MWLGYVTVRSIVPPLELLLQPIRRDTAETIVCVSIGVTVDFYTHRGSARKTSRQITIASIKIAACQVMTYANTASQASSLVRVILRHGHLLVRPINIPHGTTYLSDAQRCLQHQT
jgi:hypothetical protein